MLNAVFTLTSHSSVVHHNEHMISSIPVINPE